MDISKGIPLSGNMSRSVADLPRGKAPSKEFAADLDSRLKAAAEGIRKAEAVARGENRLEADNSPTKAVQRVMKGDQLVATIFKSGIVEISSQFSDELKALKLPNDHSSQFGSIRAAMIADAVGGNIIDLTPSSSLYSYSSFSATA